MTDNEKLFTNSTPMILVKESLPLQKALNTEIVSLGCQCGRNCSMIRTKKLLVNDRKYGKVSTLKNPPRRKRAGVYLKCELTGRIVVVQVYNEYTGLPKGGQEENETPQENAIREMFEETGIKLTSLDGNKSIISSNRATRYFLEGSDEEYPLTLHEFPENDVSAVGWVSPQCIPLIPGKTTSDLVMMVRVMEHLNISPNKKE